MYISKIKLHDFKGFKGDHELKFDAGVNFFVGDNNCGKSTVFEAVDFIRSKRDRDEVISKKPGLSDDDYVSVEIEFKGNDIATIVGGETLKKYESYLIDEAGEKSLRVMRSSKEEEVNQGGKPKILKVDNVRVFNPITNQFENPTGSDNTITALFDAQFVWADTDSSDVSDFSKTKVSGKIINAITKDFVSSQKWRDFQTAHEMAFREGDDSLANVLRPVEEKLRRIMTEQYGETEVRISFTLPEIESFFKTGNISLSENGIETRSSDKGTGMQRSLALALIQVYAEVVSGSGGDNSKPLLFFLDEPETFMHPQAQKRLLVSLETIANNSQVFVVTHSPYFLKKYCRDTHSLHLFSKENGFNKVTSGSELDLFGRSSPTWGEINYYAFGVLSVEFHNELYGFVQAKAIAENERCYYEDEFENYLINEGLEQNLPYIRLNRDSTTTNQMRTLPTKIRNMIHHPENEHNEAYTDRELKASIEMLLPLLR